MTTTLNTADREIVTTRLIDAPRALVFEAFTDPRHLAHWYGPDGFATVTQSMDLRPGGIWRFTMRGPDGKDWPNVVTFEQIAPPALLVYQHGDDREPDMFHVTVTFEDRGGKTGLTMRSVFKSAETLDVVVRENGAIEGAKQTITRLEQYLRTMQRTA